jgi:hypothetical protein
MDGKDFIENDVFIYHEEESLDEEEQFIDLERVSTKKLKEDFEKEKLVKKDIKKAKK